MAAVIGFAIMSFSISISPGASWAYVISTTTQGGLRSGQMAIAGNGTGILIHGLIAAGGLVTLLAWSSDVVFQTLRWAGAAYLIFLATRMLLQQPQLAENNAQPISKNKLRVFRDGMLVNLLNPKVMFLMVAILPQFLQPEKGFVAGQILQFGILHALIASTVLSGLAILSAKVSSLTKPGGRFRKVLRLTSAAVLMAFGLRLMSGF